MYSSNAILTKIPELKKKHPKIHLEVTPPPKNNTESNPKVRAPE